MKKNIILLTLFICQYMVSQNYNFGKVSKAELLEKSYPLDTTANAVYLHKEKQVVLKYNPRNDDFEKHVTVFQRIKIYNKKGFNVGNKSIKYYSPKKGTKDKLYKIKAVTYNLEGDKIVEHQLKKGDIFTEANDKYYSLKKVAFSDLKEGSVIELKYSLVSKFWDVSSFKIQEDIPVKSLYYYTEIPEFFKYKKISRGYYMITPEIKNVSDVISFRQKKERGFGDTGTAEYEKQKINFITEKSVYQDTNIPALKNDEPFVSSYNNYRGVVHYDLEHVQFPYGAIKYYAKSWKSVCSELYTAKYFGQQLEKKQYFKKDLKNVLAGLNTDPEKIAAIFQFVKNKIKWNGYAGIYVTNGIESSYSKGEGNISEVNLVLVSMLREAGIDSNPILLSTKNNGTPIYPTLDRLNYVIAAVLTKEGRVMYLDASEPYCPVNVLPKRALNQTGRMLVSKSVNKTVPLLENLISEEMHIAKLSFDKDFKLLGTVNTRLTNNYALNFRKKFSLLSKSSVLEKLSKQYHISIDSFQIKNKQSIYKPVMVKVDVSSNDFKEVINDKVYVNPLLFYKEKTSPYILETRKYPVDLVTKSKDVKIISLKIPDGYTVTSLPSNIEVRMSNNYGKYLYKISQVGNTLNIVTTRVFNTTSIPVKYYNELKDLYATIISKSNEKIVLEKL